MIFVKQTLYLNPIFSFFHSSIAGNLPPLNSESDEPCREREGCFLAGDTRGNANTALAAMHTVWVRLHNFYANEIIKVFKNNPGKFQSTSFGQNTFNDLVFYDARGIAIAICQRTSMRNGFQELLLLISIKDTTLKFEEKLQMNL